MHFIPTVVAGAMVIDLASHRDGRGSFARTYCCEEFALAGISFEILQANLSRNPMPFTLRGMHYQAYPHEEAKLIQCTRGRIFDAAVDMRPSSPSFGRATWIELDADEDRLFFIPPGCAHGFLTLRENSDVLYYMGARFVQGVDQGVRWDDPRFGIPWPARPLVISERDAAYPLIEDGKAQRP